MNKERARGAAAILLAALLAAPAAARAQAQAEGGAQAGDPAAASPSYAIGPEDVIGVLVWREPDMSGDVTVRPDGKISLPLIGDLEAAGRTPESLAAEIQKAAARFVDQPNVSVVIRQVNSRKVFITGQVKQSGSFPLAGPRTVLQLIALAGGLTEYADAGNIRVMRTEDGRTRTYKFNYKDVSKGQHLEQNIELKPGDTVVVP
jgi:polysaccharide biosynthesis/export protein